jgi:hypothetical protein
MPAGIYHFSVANESQVEQGATFEAVLTWKNDDETPVDLTGYTARMQIRQTINDPTTEAELTTENGRIELGGVDGTITLMIPADVTEDFAWNDPAVYDLELISGTGKVTRVLKGNVELDEEVTK